MGYDIHTTIILGLWVCAGLYLFTLISGLRTIRSGKNTKFLRIRKQQIKNGQRLIAISFAVGALGIFLWRLGEPIAYQIYPPTMTLTQSPTSTVTPTITQTPTITLTAPITDTPSITNTPFIPDEILSGFSSSITPNPSAIFSPFEFAQSISKARAVNPTAVFQNPVGHLYGVFSYNNMIEGSQWTAIWYRGTEIVYYESKPWDGSFGGWGYTDWNPTPDKWLAGQYLVVIFVGTQPKVSGTFKVVGDAPTSIPSPISTPIPTQAP